jgi:AcrR family transcriptional regulator
MEHAVAEVAEATRDAEPQRGEPKEALERVLRATWRELDRFHALLAINTTRLSAQDLHRRPLPVLTQFAPLIERGQKEGVFRSDLPVSWHLAVIRAIVHTASSEIQSGRIPESKAEDAMLSTVNYAISERPS